MKFKVPLSGHVEDLEDGRVVAPGEEVDLSRKEITDSDHNKLLLSDGRLIASSDAGVRLARELAGDMEKVEEEVAAPPPGTEPQTSEEGS